MQYHPLFLVFTKSAHHLTKPSHDASDGGVFLLLNRYLRLGVAPSCIALHLGIFRHDGSLHLLVALIECQLCLLLHLQQLELVVEVCLCALLGAVHPRLGEPFGILLGFRLHLLTLLLHRFVVFLQLVLLLFHESLEHR